MGPRAVHGPDGAGGEEGGLELSREVEWVYSVRFVHRDVKLERVRFPLLICTTLDVILTFHGETYSPPAPHPPPRTRLLLSNQASRLRPLPLCRPLFTVPDHAVLMRIVKGECV